MHKQSTYHLLFRDHKVIGNDHGKIFVFQTFPRSGKGPNAGTVFKATPFIYALPPILSSDWFAKE
jgi:hypothetical protein